MFLFLSLPPSFSLCYADLSSLSYPFLFPLFSPLPIPLCSLCFLLPISLLPHYKSTHVLKSLSAPFFALWSILPFLTLHVTSYSLLHSPFLLLHSPLSLILIHSSSSIIHYPFCLSILRSSSSFPHYPFSLHHTPSSILHSPFSILPPPLFCFPIPCTLLMSL